MQYEHPLFKALSHTLKFVVIAVVIALSSVASVAQVDDFCTEFGAMPSLNSPFANIPYVFGKINHKAVAEKTKIPKIIVILIDGDQTNKRVTVGRSGNYCFRRTGGGGTLIVEIDGIEAARRSLPTFGATQQREDFEISSSASDRPGTVSAKFSHPPNEKTAELYKRAAQAETEKNTDEVVKLLQQIVTVDPEDFIAHGKLGSMYIDKKKLTEAEASLRRAIALKLEYTPAWINFGLLRLELKQYEAAVEVFKHAVSLDAESARGFQLLGEAYLLSKQGSLGAEALNKAIKIDPLGMAALHLQLAHLYQLAGAKGMATKEYRMFLDKVPTHPERAKFEKFIKDNPD